MNPQEPDSPATLSSAHPLSYARPGTENRRAGFLVSRSVGRHLIVFAIVMTGLSLYSESGPAEYGLPLIASAFGWFGALGWWAIKVILCVTAAVRRQPFAPRSWWMFFAVPFLFVLTIALARWGVPSAAGFWIERPTMEKIATAQLLTPDGTTLSRNVGIYGPCEFSHEGSCVTIRVKDAGFLDDYGYAYCPTGPTTVPGWTTPISGAWYMWFHRF